MLSRVGSGVLALALLPAPAAAQETIPAIAVSPIYVPPTPADRLNWAVQGTLSPPVLAVTAIDSAWSTRANWPEEWGRSASGFGKRFADDAAYGAISNTVEAAAGGLWGEDPRYRRVPERTTWRRFHHALMATVLAPRRDGHLAPAWARFGAIGTAIRIENTWLPPSARTPSSVGWRVADDLMWRAVSNVWDEFWPDVRRRVRP